MTARISKCASANSCQKSLTFHFMQAARWVALLLLCGVGIGLTALEFFRHENISWVFLCVCCQRSNVVLVGAMPDADGM